MPEGFGLFKKYVVPTLLRNLQYMVFPYYVFGRVNGVQVYHNPIVVDIQNSKDDCTRTLIIICYGMHMHFVIACVCTRKVALCGLGS